MKTVFPVAKLSQEEANAIQANVLDMLDEIPDEGNLPILTNLLLTSGAYIPRY